MKQLFLTSCLCLCCYGAFSQSDRYNKLVWSDEFNKKDFIDPEKWTKVERGGADWHDTMTDDDACFDVRRGKLVLRGIVNPDRSVDTVRHLTGGLTTLETYAFDYGRVEIRVKTENAKGAWPALWLLGLKGGWPSNGEIDMLEHLNNDDFIYQTVHTHYTYQLKHTTNPPNSAKAPYKQNKYNIIALEKDEDMLTFYVNGEKTFEYPRIETDIEGQWPYNQPFYLILSQQLGGSWVGEVDDKDLPVDMFIDWVRVYQ